MTVSIYQEKEDGKGLTSTVSTAIFGFENYVIDGENRIISTARDASKVTETAGDFNSTDGRTSEKHVGQK